MRTKLPVIATDSADAYESERRCFCSCNDGRNALAPHNRIAFLTPRGENKVLKKICRELFIRPLEEMPNGFNRSYAAGTQEEL